MDILRFLKLPLLAAAATLAIATMVAPASTRADSAHDSHHGSPGHDMGTAMRGMTHAEHAGGGMAPDKPAMRGMTHAEHAGGGMAPDQPAMRGMTHAEHAGGGMAPEEHAMQDMTPEEHAAHSGHTDEHSASSGHDASHHEEAVAKDRPVELVLAGFAVLNALVLLAAVILRRRPAAIKRRETLDRVRRAAGAGEPEPTGEASS